MAVQKIQLPFELFDYDAVECAARYGEVRITREPAGTTIGSMDLLIAAHALALSATLVTNNSSHFRRVRSLKVTAWK